MAARSFRKVCKEVSVEEVAAPEEVVPLDEPALPEASLIAETRLLKSVFKVSRLPAVVDDELEEEEEELNWEINSSSLLAKLE
ncbi:MAG: hypothetical protein P4L43_09720 [Syntrophobacteraceae bacterium]|nr:hypothetical protein [Syntrophobacteraceae bacterium]